MTPVQLRQRHLIERKIPVDTALYLKMLREINLGATIDDAIDWDTARWRVTPGNLAELMVLAAMSDLRVPLYQLGDRLKDVDLSYLYDGAITAEDINQYNMGEMLERLGAVHPEKIYEKIALTALTTYHIEVERLHADTTSLSFWGAYEGTGENEGEVRIVRGYNKDGRPNCNQIVVGQITNENGIVLEARVMNGNTSDSEWNGYAIEHVKQIQQTLKTGAPLIADSKLICQEHVKTLLAENIRFISRCPANYNQKLAARMIRQAYQPDSAWQDLGTFGQGKNASRYQGQLFQEQIEDKTVQLLVLQSSSLAEKAEESLIQEQNELLTQARVLQKKVFYCEADVDEELKRFRKDARLVRYTDTWETAVSTIEHWPRGRRAKNSQPTSTTSQYQLVFKALTPQADAIRQYREDNSCLVLIAYVPESYGARDILAAYKGQQEVENSFRLLKTPAVASVIYLENEQRIMGLTMLLHVALLIRALIQYRMRKGYAAWLDEHPGQHLAIGWANQKPKSLTYKMFFDHSRGIYYLWETNGSFTLSYASQENFDKIDSYLSLMGLGLQDLLEKA